MSLGSLTLRHLRWQIVRLLSADMYPVKVIIQVLMVITGPRTIIKRTSPYRRNMLLVTIVWLFKSRDLSRFMPRCLTCAHHNYRAHTAHGTAHKLPCAKLKSASTSSITVILFLQHLCFLQPISPKSTFCQSRKSQAVSLIPGETWPNICRTESNRLPRPRGKQKAMDEARKLMVKINNPDAMKAYQV